MPRKSGIASLPGNSQTHSMREPRPPLPSVSLIYVQLLTRLQHERRVLLLAQLSLDSFTMASISSASDEHHTNKVIELDAPYALDH